MRWIFYFFLLCFVARAEGEAPFVHEESGHPAVPLNLSFGAFYFPSEEELDSLQDAPLPLQNARGPHSWIDRDKACVWFFKTGLENEDGSLGHNEMFEGYDDFGYTHGHIASLLRACSSGSDLNFRISSRIYTWPYGYDVSELAFGDPIALKRVKERGQDEPFIDLKIDDVLALKDGLYPAEERRFPRILNFEEESRLTVELSDWRDFRQDFYNRAGIFAGRLSINDSLTLAGIEHKLFHDSLGGAGEIEKYQYKNGGETKNFAGVLIAFGKSLPLLNEPLRQGSVCSHPCFGYITGEGGMELVSEERLSFVYIASEMNKAVWFSDSQEPLAGLTIGIKAKKYLTEGEALWDGFLGLDARLFDGVFAHAQIKKREVLSDEGYYLRYDADDEPVFYLGMSFRL